MRSTVVQTLALAVHELATNCLSGALPYQLGAQTRYAFEPDGAR